MKRDKKIDIRIRGLKLSITVKKIDGWGRSTTNYYNDVFLTTKDLLLFLKNFLENQYLTNLKGGK